MNVVKIINPKDDLQKIVDEINSASWDETNEISKYDVESLTNFLNRQDTLFVTCHNESSDRTTLRGIASGRVEIKPYGNERWLYIDEVDVCADHRQKGAGKAIMRKLLDYAWSKGCEEVWLGTETDNIPANSLYRSLKPDEIEQFVGYAYEIDE